MTTADDVRHRIATRREGFKKFTIDNNHYYYYYNNNNLRLANAWAGHETIPAKEAFLAFAQLAVRVGIGIDLALDTSIDRFDVFTIEWTLYNNNNVCQQ
jgi:hypothetical protein